MGSHRVVETNIYTVNYDVMVEVIINDENIR